MLLVKPDAAYVNKPPTSRIGLAEERKRIKPFNLTQVVQPVNFTASLNLSLINLRVT